MVELHDCFSTNELITYEALGLCAEGELKVVTLIAKDTNVDVSIHVCLTL